MIAQLPVLILTFYANRHRIPIYIECEAEELPDIR